MSVELCPACNGTDLHVFHDVDEVPVNSCLLVPDLETAVTFPRGRLRLAHCSACGFVTNTEFDAERSVYSAEYEETQAYSATFVEFIGSLAREWVDRHQLRGKSVVEIGCGKGEFLAELVRAGVGSATGVDPGVHPERVAADVRERATWVQGFFPSDFPVLDADAVVCRHTLEHIGPVSVFLEQVKSALASRRDTVLLFELPDTLRVLEEVAFWDTYYEHCSYFTAGSLARLFRRCGFDVLDVRRAYDDQYLLLEARLLEPGSEPRAPASIEDDLATVGAAAGRFATSFEAGVEGWRDRLRGVARDGGRAVIWGSGSKGVAFLAALGDDARLVDLAVDINPYKHGRWMAGTGHQIVAPDELKALAPTLVVAMNPAYLDEIGRDLERLGIHADLVAL